MRALIVNPFASGVSEASSRPSRRRFRPEPRRFSRRRGRRDRARGRVVVRARRRSTSSRATGPTTRCSTASAPTSRRVRPRRRHERAAARARAAARSRCAPPSGSRFGKPRRISSAAINGRRFAFNAGIGLRRRARAAGRRARPPARTARGPATSPSPGRRPRRWSERRFRYEPALEVEGLGRAAFALVANCSPYTYAGRLGLRFAPEASFEGGLDVVAPLDVRAARIPRLARAGPSRTSAPRLCPSRPRPRPDRDPLRRPAARQVDGEDIGDIEEAEIVAVRDAVTVLVVGTTLPAWPTRSRCRTWARG